MRQRARLLCFVAILILVASCAHMTVPAGPTPPSSPSSPPEKMAPPPCPGPKADPTKSARGPVICIDANSLEANPDHQLVYRGAWIHFYLTEVNQELDIVFAEPKVELKERKGNECWLRVKSDAAPGRAKYTAINVTTGKRNDPDIMIDPAP